jgi:phage terminase Nu1 subunit (DNA packaging protein)
MPTVDFEKLVRALNLEKRRVQQLVHEGMPKEGRGQYDPIKCMHFNIQYLQRALETKTASSLDGDVVGEREEQVRLLRAHADLREMKLVRELSQVISINVADRKLADLIRTTTARLTAVRPPPAPDLVGETSLIMIQAKLERAIHDRLRFLAKGPGLAFH